MFDSCGTAVLTLVQGRLELIFMCVCPHSLRILGVFVFPRRPKILGSCIDTFHPDNFHVDWKTTMRFTVVEDHPILWRQVLRSNIRVGSN